jgi:hypothetical protein
MPNAASILESLVSRMQQMPLEQLLRLHRVVCEMDANLHHQPAPAGWIPLHQVAERIGRDRRHLTRSCPAWAATGKARKFIRGRHLTWHLAPDLAADLSATLRNGCANGEAFSPRAAQSARPSGASLDQASNSDYTSVDTAYNRGLPATAPSKVCRAPSPENASTSKVST